jgi:hypothetical protein
MSTIQVSWMTFPGYYGNQNECVYWAKAIFHVIANQSENLQDTCSQLFVRYQQKVSIEGNRLVHESRLGMTVTPS